MFKRIVLKIEGVQSWIRIFPEGEVKIRGDEPAFINKQSAENLIAIFRTGGNQMVIDYEHQTLTGEVAPAAGWITDLEWRDGDGLYARAEWTSRALEYIRAGEYKYFSPVFMMTPEREIVELYNLGLTNQPRLQGLDAIAAKFSGKENKMGIIDRIKEILGLPTEAEDETIEQEIIRLRELVKEKENVPEEAAAKEAVLEALGLPRETTEREVVAQIHALKQEASRPDLTEEVRALKRRLGERDRDELVARAISEGNITPAQKGWAEKYAMEDPAGFKIFLAKAPVVIPVDGLSVNHEDPVEPQIDPGQQAINKSLGVSGEDWKQYGPHEQV